MNETLPRAHIIRRRATFDLTRQRGRRINNRWMTLSVLPRESGALDSSTVAFLTPKRVGPATVRNKLRRRMREIYRRDLAKPEEGAFLIWIARAGAGDLDFGGLKEAMLELDRKREGWGGKA